MSRSRSIKDAGLHLSAPALDWAIALGLTLALEISILWDGKIAGPRGLIAPLFLLATVPLAWRRRAPLLVLGLGVGAGVTQAVVTHQAHEGGFDGIALAIAAYSLGAYARPRQVLAGVGLLTVGSALQDAYNPHVRTAEELWATAFWWLAVIVIVLVGVYVGRRREAAALEERALEAERAREEEARAAVADERARIARELHDIVSHNVSLMVVQAEAAETVLEKEPSPAGEPLQRIQRAGREALVEMRRMLGVLREDGDSPDLAPQPGMAALDALVAQVGEAGLPVTVTVEGEPRPLPPGIDLAAYRVIQEALTNALKHAGPATAELRIRYAEDAIAMEVSDDGRGQGDRTDGGHGLVGMRERVHLYGGEVETGPDPRGGYRVQARLPAP